ncbi:MAG: deaminase [Candidatus Brocadiales bacterium]
MEGETEGRDWAYRAFVEAARAVDKAYPYPGVGVIIVEEGRIVASAHNGEPGEPHAETKALNEARTKAKDLTQAVLYTNLEPCVNVGLTHSCAEEIVHSGIQEVHIALEDPYYLVRGKGTMFLRGAGLTVTVGEYAEQARWQNKRYFDRFCPNCGWPIKD